MKKKIVFRIGFMVLVLAIPVWLISRLLVKSTNSQVAGVQDEAEAAIEGPLGVLPVNYDFSYALDKKNDPDSPRLLFSVSDAELRKEILVKGKKATAIEDRAFLVFNLKIANTNNQGVEISTRDFFRLATAENPAEWLAPDIHNDPVEVQAISTKYTRIGFPVDLAGKNWVLQVGQIDGEKTQLPLNFQ